jgi:molecular chaperone DnaK (HSP70)
LAIGGRDIDHWIASEFCSERIGGSLLEAAEKLKCSLSDQDEAVVLWSPPEQTSRELTLSRTALDAVLERRGLVALLDELLERVLAAARAQGLAIRDLDAVLPVGGSSRLPLIRSWLRERFAGIPLRDERPVEAVALGALSLTPGVRVRDVLSRGVSLRCWDQRGGRHRWHPLFLAGQSWPTTLPLELVLACSREGQRQLELVLGEPVEEERSEVIFRGGLPELRRRPAGEARVEPWSAEPLPLPLSPPGDRGVDRLRLRFGIDEQARLTLVSEDLLTGVIQAPVVLGPVR